MGNADAHNIGQEEQIEQILKIENNIAGRGKRGKAQFFHRAYLGSLVSRSSHFDFLSFFCV
jgi:hypothetical protein